MKVKKHIMTFIALIIAIAPTFASSNIFSDVFILQKTYAEDSTDIKSKDFMLDVNEITPSKNKYTQGPKDNINDVLSKTTRYLMIAVTSLSVLFMVIWAIKIILAWGDSNEIQNGKKIITYNIIAIVVALLSYSIINLVIWILWSNA